MRSKLAVKRVGVDDSQTMVREHLGLTKPSPKFRQAYEPPEQLKRSEISSTSLIVMVVSFISSGDRGATAFPIEI